MIQSGDRACVLADQASPGALRVFPRSLRSPLVALTHRLAVAALVAAPAVTVLHAPPAFAAPPAADVQRATQRFIKGTELLKQGRHAQALEEFKQSYALVPSPNSHLYIARCLAQLGQTRAAWLEFDRTAAEATNGGPKYAQTHDSALQERDDLSSRLALVAIVVQGADPSASVRVGSYDLPPDRIGQPFPIDPGQVDVVMQAPGRPPVVQTITLRAGERRDVIVAPPAAPVGPVAAVAEAPAPRRLNGLRVGAVVAGAVGVAGFIMFAVEGAASKSTFNSLSATCGGRAGCAGASPAQRNEANSQISSGQTQQTVANVGVVIGAVGIATGVTLLALSFRRSPDARAPSGQLVVGPRWAGLQGSF
jgi:hypothetical protein